VDHRAGDDVDPFVAQVSHGELLVGRVRLDEREPPGRQCRADGRRDGEETGSRRGHARHEQAVDSGSPIRPRHERRNDVRPEESRHEQEDVLYPVERPQQDKCRDRDSSHRDRGVAAYACEIEARGHTGELCAGRTDVRDEKRKHSECRRANSVPLAHETRQPLTRDDSHACTEFVEENERKRRDAENPQELVAVVGPKDRICGDAGCVVV
jgi:hypothetical protein